MIANPKIRWCMWSVLLHVACVSSSCVVSVTSRVSSVKIHGNKAEVTREFETAEYDYDSYCTVRVEGLTAQMEDKSVRVKGVGAAEILESAVTSQSTSRDSSPVLAAQTAFLQELVHYVSAEVDAAKAAVSRSGAQKQYVDMYTRTRLDEGRKPPPSLPSAAGGGHGESVTATLSVESMAEVLRFQDAVAADMDQKIATANRKLREQLGHLRALETRMQTLRDSGEYDPYVVDGRLFCPASMDCSDTAVSAPSVLPSVVASKSVEIRVHTAPAASSSNTKPPLKFSVTYLAGPARWYAEYDIRLEGNAVGSSRQYLIEVDYYAAVEQQTHEVCFLFI